MPRITIHSDGAARGNPGPAGAGAVLRDESGAVVAEVSEYIGETTNNQAEYQALIFALGEAKRLGATSVAVFADSELMVRQLNGDYRVKNEGLKPLYQEAFKALRAVGEYTIEHLPRERNKEADKLANRAIDQKFDL
ncbi:MAG: ribonuclease HI family protein [Proteobacteria bacterium]|nr:ribonuclease HI family protein [Pseudomonadota bacterium]